MVKLTPSIRLFGILLLALALSGAVVAFSERTHRRLGEANQQIATSTEAQGILSENDAWGGMMCLPPLSGYDIALKRLA